MMVSKDDFHTLTCEEVKGRMIHLTLSASLVNPGIVFVLEGKLGGYRDFSLVVDNPKCGDLSAITDFNQRKDVHQYYSGNKAHIPPRYIVNYQFV